MGGACGREWSVFLSSGRSQTRRAGWRQILASVVCFLCLAGGRAEGFSREVVCARQENINGWSRPYRVDALILRGLELNKAKQNMHYKPGSLYVVLLWDKDNSTAIELPSPRFPDIGQTGRDERGNRWELWKGHGCRAGP